MKPLALVLAAAVLGTGCYTEDRNCPRSVTVDWTFLTADGAVVSSCGPVQWIDVWVNGNNVASFPCSGPPGAVPLARGSNAFTVEAVDADGVTILYRDEFTVDGTACGDHGIVASQPAEGRVNLAYSVPNDQCYTPGPSFIWVKVQDDIASVVAADSAAAPESNNVCGSPVTFRLAMGTYTLQKTQEMIRLGTFPQSYGTVGRDCTQRQFTVGAALVTDVPATLVDAATGCP